MQHITSLSVAAEQSPAAMAGTSPAHMDNMEVDTSSAAFPPLAAPGKRERAPSPSKDASGKTPRTNQDPETPPDHQYIMASFLLRAVSGDRVFNNPSKVSHALHHSSLEKYIVGGKPVPWVTGQLSSLVCGSTLFPRSPTWPRILSSWGSGRFTAAGPRGTAVTTSTPGWGHWRRTLTLMW